MKPLHTKYRPKTFDEIIGNENIVTCLKGMFAKESHPHVFLFSGERGCGKTSFARIIGREMDCQQIQYVNVANERGIDTAREIIESSRYRPLKGTNKLYILDEVQATTTTFQQSLLNILEETPPHVYFVLCTTNPEKILGTVKARCHHFEVRPLDSEKSENLIQEICKKEGVEISEKAMRKIVELSEGRPRDILILLEKYLSMGSSGLSEELLQAEDEFQIGINKLCQALMKGDDWDIVQKIINRLFKQDTTKDPESIRRNMLAYFNAVALNKRMLDKRLILLYECFKEPLYNTGKAGLTFACMYSLI